MKPSILDHPIIRERYFFPRREPIPKPFMVDCGEAQLACYYDAPNPEAKTFVHFHGNGEVVADYLPDFADTILAMGINVLLAEYRGYGGSTGKPALVGMLENVERIFEELALPASQLILFGRSIGSLYAIEFVYRHPEVAGLILESGIANPLERLLVRLAPEELGVTESELSKAVLEHFDHQKKLGSYAGPLLVLHTEHDEMVDRSHAHRNHDWAGGTRKELVFFEQGGHNTIMAANWNEYMAVVERFVNSLS